MCGNPYTVISIKIHSQKVYEHTQSHGFWRFHEGVCKDMHNITRYVSDLLGRTRLSIDAFHSLLCPYFILGQMDIKQGHTHWLKSCYTTWWCLMCSFTTIFITLSNNIVIDCSSKDCMYFLRSHFSLGVIYVVWYIYFVWTLSLLWTVLYELFSLETSQPSCLFWYVSC